MKTKLSIARFAAASVLALLSQVAYAGQTSYFIYDEAGHVIGEYDANGNPIQEHVYLGDRPVAVVQAGNANNIDYVATDQQNTPRVVTDAQQAVVWTWNRDPAGNGQPTGSITYNLRLPGQYSDAETGHHYNYYRDYDPATGRYAESDPSGLGGGINSYVYVKDNFATSTDPFGLCSPAPAPTPTPTPPSPTPTPPAQGPTPTGNCVLNALRDRYGDTLAQAIQFFTLTNLMPSFGPYEGGDDVGGDWGREAANVGIPKGTEAAGALMQNPSIVNGGVAAGASVEGGGAVAAEVVDGILVPIAAFATAAHDYAVGECAGAW